MTRIYRFFPALLALVTIASSTLPASSQGYTTQTIEVSEAGFNPGVCRMNREYVAFKNVGSTPIRVIRPGIVANPEPLIDTGYLEPGQTSRNILIPHGGTTVFYDADRMEHSTRVLTPVLVEYWDPVCTPDPDFQPPQPPCRGNEHCLRVPALASD